MIWEMREMNMKMETNVGNEKDEDEDGERYRQSCLRERDGRERKG